MTLSNSPRLITAAEQSTTIGKFWKREWYEHRCNYDKKLTRFYRFVNGEAKHVYGLIAEGSSLNMSNVLGTHLLLSFYF